MNKLLRASLLAALAAVALSAQSLPAFRVDVPFEFVVGARTFPAGLYIVDHATGPDTLIIKSTEGQGAVILLTNPMKGTRGPAVCRLLFHRYGDVSFLSEVWYDGAGYGHQVRPTSREHELAAGVAARQSIAVLAAR